MELFFLTRGGCYSCSRAYFGARLLLQSYWYPNLSEGDRVAGQLRGNKECPFCGVTKSGRVWRKVPESGARSVEADVGRLEGGKGGGVRVHGVNPLTAVQLDVTPHERRHDAPDVTSLTTLRASLSGTFLQTLPDLVTPLKGHSLFPRSCPSTRSAPPKGLSTDKTAEAR